MSDLTPFYVPAPPMPYPRADVTLIRANQPTALYAAATNPFARGDLIRGVLENDARMGDILLLGDYYPGGAIVGAKLLTIPYGVGMFAYSPLHTVLRSQFVNDAANGCCFDLGGLNWLQGITFQSDAGPSDQAAVIGWSGNAQGDQAHPSNYTSWITGCSIRGANFGAYIWGGYGNRLVIRSTDIYTSRWAITAGCSGGDDACFIDASGVRIIGDSSLSTHTGNQGLRLVGVACRGGTTTLNSMEIVLSAVAGVPMNMVAGVWTPITDTSQGDIEGGSPYTKVSIKRSDIRIATANSPRAHDFDIGCGETRVIYCTGSLPNGDMTYQTLDQGKVTFIPTMEQV